MFRSQLIKDLPKWKSYFAFSMMHLSQKPSPDTILKINEYFDAQMDNLQNRYFTTPCFYLGELDADDPSIAKMTDFKFLKKDERVTIKKIEAFSHLPYTEMSIAYKTNVEIVVPENDTFVTKSMAANILIPLTSAPTNGNTISGQYLSMKYHWVIETPVMEVLMPNKSDNNLYLLPVRIILLENNESYFIGISTPDFLTAGLAGPSVYLIRSILRSTFYFLNLLSCRNTVVRDWTPNAKKNSHSKKHRKPELDYKIINITLPKKKIIYQGKETNELPFHERSKYGTVTNRRDHFKTYTADAPLLGKHVGTFYWPEISNFKEGITYNVKIDK